MTDYTLTIELLTDTTFASGESVVGLVDTEITYDAKTGLPYIRGRVLKGLLVESCADILFALQQAQTDTSALEDAAKWLFGTPGSDIASTGHMRVGNATLPDADALAAAIKADGINAKDVLDAYTVVRRQTSSDESTYGAPEKGSLRSARAVRRTTVFKATITLDGTPPASAEALLAACAAGVRHAGSGRNRGRGEVRLALKDAPLSEFAKVIEGGQA